MNTSTWEYRFEGLIGRMIDWLGDDPLRRSVGPPPPATSAPGPAAVTENSDDSLAARVLRLLTEADDGAAMRDLSDATGATRHQLRAALKELTDAGRIRRLGAGLTTRYERIN